MVAAPTSYYSEYWCTTRLCLLYYNSLLNILQIHSFASKPNSNHIIKYADDFTVMCLV